MFKEALCRPEPHNTEGTGRKMVVDYNLKYYVGCTPDVPRWDGPLLTI
jgi:hypothetical protein